MSGPEKSKQISVHRQQKAQRWRYVYRKIGMWQRVGIVVVTEYSESFSKSDQPAYEETSLITRVKFM